MYYSFDVYGWFAGAVANGSPRSVPDVPPDTSTSTTPGAARAFWDGFAWQLRPYAPPVANVTQDEQPAPDAPLYLFIWGLDKLHGITENDCDTAINAVADNRTKRKLKAWFGRGPTIAADSWEYENLRVALGISKKKMNAAMWWAADKAAVANGN